MRVRTIYIIGTVVTVVSLVVGTVCGMTSHDWATGADVSLIYMGVLATAWSVLYGIRSAWRSSAVGRAVLTQSVILAAVLIQGAVSQWIDHDYPWRHEIRFALYSLGAVSFVAMLRSLWREQQRDRRQR